MCVIAEYWRRHPRLFKCDVWTFMLDAESEGKLRGGAKKPSRYRYQENVPKI